MDKNRLLNQLKEDEGFTSKAFWDIKQWTYGYGCRAQNEGATITEPEAAIKLAAKMKESIADFERIFKGHTDKFNDVRAECFVNLIFNMGPGAKGHPENGGLCSFVNTLALIFNNKDVPWGQVADGLKKSLWFRQVGDSGEGEGRGNRIVRQVKTGLV